MTDGRRELWWESPTCELGRVVDLPLDAPFVAEHGGTLPAIQTSWEEWGPPDAPPERTALIIHPMTADCHVTGAWAGQPRGWWEDLIGPGRAIDTDRWRVLCPNLLGGCYGTTGPRHPAPDGAPWLDRFPLLTPRDLLRAQRLFLEAIGVERLGLVVGPSMGGMVAWEWAIEAPEVAGAVAVVAAPLRTTPHQIGLNWLQRRGIELDFAGDEAVAKQGQMVARGVGMLSYRSPTGLEEKFGREWFRKPGSTLKDRGMFNVESWLRQHGRRITKRFDPYTYLLYSRAMDLHDVSRGREDLVTALDRVTCPVLVVGIGSDYLYPPDEVHHGVDLLDHLGRDVHYDEIRSLHGHDAFLIDVDQIDAILRAWRPGRPQASRVRSSRTLRPVRIGILGAGRVAAAFVRLVGDRGDAVARDHGLVLDVRGVAEIDPDKPLDPAFAGLTVSRDPEAFLRDVEVDVVLDLTRGVGVRPLVEAALRRRRHVVTPNKVLLRAAAADLDRIALDAGVRLAWHDAIAAGWPLLHALDRPVARRRVSAIRGMLSSSSNVMLERIEQGASFEEALEEARALDLLEPDPSLDLDGWDAAQKLMILHTRTSRRRRSGDDIERTGIRGLDPLLVRAAPAQGMRIKLVALVLGSDAEARAVVRPMAVPTDSHLGSVRGADHLVVFEDPEAGETVFLGEGAGTVPVAIAVLNDVIGLFDPQRSWTGRFPVAAGRLPAPAFDTWVALDGGSAVRTAAPSPPPGAVPWLDPRAH